MVIVTKVDGSHRLTKYPFYVVYFVSAIFVGPA